MLGNKPSASLSSGVKFAAEGIPGSLPQDVSKWLAYNGSESDKTKVAVTAEASLGRFEAEASALSSKMQQKLVCVLSARRVTAPQVPTLIGRTGSGISLVRRWRTGFLHVCAQRTPPQVSNRQTWDASARRNRMASVHRWEGKRRLRRRLDDSDCRGGDHGLRRCYEGEAVTEHGCAQCDSRVHHSRQV